MDYNLLSVPESTTKELATAFSTRHNCGYKWVSMVISPLLSANKVKVETALLRNLIALMLITVDWATALINTPARLNGQRSSVIPPHLKVGVWVAVPGFNLLARKG